MAARMRTANARFMRAGIIASCIGIVLCLGAEARADNSATIRSPSELAGGVVIATLGGVSLTIGSALLVATQCVYCDSGWKGSVALALPLVIGGIIATVGGVWMAHEGGHRTRRRWSLSPFGLAATF